MKTIVAAINAKYIHTALSLRLLKAYAEDEFEIDMAEYTIKDPVLHIAADLYNRKPDVIGFSCYIWNIEATLAVARILKQVLPDVRIVLGGPEVSFDPGYFLGREPAVDIVVMGEGEAVFKALLSCFADGLPVDTVAGIAWREGKDIRVNPPQAKLDLEYMPSPYRFEADRAELGKRIVYFETSRGCPFNCQFCLSSTETGVRFFDKERVKADLKYLIQAGARTIKFLDRTFNINRDYALDIFQFLIDHHDGCVFQFEITADIMRPEVLEFLNKEAPPGIFRFEIGIQSTNEETNRLVKRRQNWDKLCRTVRLIKEGSKIDQHLDLIAGLPGEDYASFKKTFNDVFALRPEELQLGFLKLLRGTGLRADADRYGYKYMEHAPYEMLENDVLPFSDVLRIKRVEDILEKYWNSHRADYTVNYLTQRSFATSYDFFQQFGDDWAGQGWERIGHQLHDLFLRLEQFLERTQVPDLDVIRSLMRLDYMLQHRHKPRTLWWTSPSKAEVGAWMKQLADAPEQLHAGFGSLELTEQALHKHAMVDLWPCDAVRLVETGEADRSVPSAVIVLFGEAAAAAERRQLPRWYACPAALNGHVIYGNK
ncbi:DUF4080 domain-containing protein [Paenibacillus thiaminolyticus]|uniref:B12-binding domain-containing radical SAM protein n=1 Tax=Paenibacillus thiaminolyticus TaxID=49283 RepID=UPI003D2D4844